MTQKNFDFFISSIRKVFLIFLLTHVVLTNGYGQSFSKEEINDGRAGSKCNHYT